jgi:hypothetical protein
METASGLADLAGAITTLAAKAANAAPRCIIERRFILST